MENLRGLRFFHKNGISEIFRWREEDIFKYFFKHKHYYQTNYRNRKLEMDRLIPPNEQHKVEDKQVQLAYLEATNKAIIDMEDNFVEKDFHRLHKRSCKKRKEKYGEKKRKMFEEQDKGEWNDLTKKDKLSICQKITGVKLREKVPVYMKKWIHICKTTGQSVPKIGKTVSSKELISTVAMWAMETGAVEFVGDREARDFFIEK